MVADRWEGQFGDRISCHAPITRFKSPSILAAWVRISSHRIALCPRPSKFKLTHYPVSHGARKATFAAVAWKKLTPAARAEVTKLLRENPNYEDWIDGVSLEDADEIAFITAATWSDFIKGANGYANDGEHSKGSTAGQNIGYDDKLQHRYWHFYDKPFSPDKTKLGKPDKVNALTQIRLFTIALKTTNDDSVRSYDLVWLEHIVGDVHQRLHATSRVDKQDPKGDNGGNRVRLCTQKQAAAGNLKACTANLLLGRPAWFRQRSRHGERPRRQAGQCGCDGCIQSQPV